MKKKQQSRHTKKKRNVYADVDAIIEGKGVQTPVSAHLFHLRIVKVSIIDRVVDNYMSIIYCNWR